VWDAQEGRMLDTLVANSAIFSAAFSPDGKHLVTAGADRTARIYVVDFNEMLSDAKQQLPINSGN
jgi:WD40 repeat protein